MPSTFDTGEFLSSLLSQASHQQPTFDDHVQTMMDYESHYQTTAVDDAQPLTVDDVQPMTVDDVHTPTVDDVHTPTDDDVQSSPQQNTAGSSKKSPRPIVKHVYERRGSRKRYAPDKYTPNQQMDELCYFNESLDQYFLIMLCYFYVIWTCLIR